MTTTNLHTAPDLAFTNADGAEIHLSDFWESAPNGIVLVFLRHFGCIFCRDHSTQLREHYAEFQDRGWQVVAIGQGTQARAAKFRADNDLPYPILGDRSLDSYRAYGLTHGGMGGLLQPKSWPAGVRSMLHGHRPGRPDGGDINQNPGTVLIDGSGRIHRARIGQHAGDFPSAREILGWIDSQN
jgi:peroxiredoxin